MMNVLKAYTQLSKQYENNEFVNSLVVRIVLSYLQNYKTTEDFYMHLSDEFNLIDKARLYLKKISEGYPYQYLIKTATFNGSDYYVDERVLIPRMETEELVQEVLSYVENQDLVIGDVCTGSGCIAIEIKKRSSNSKVYGSDISLDAINVANMNAKNMGIDVIFLSGDLLLPFIDNDIRLDVLVSNPPYIQNRDEVDENVINYEPNLALFAEHGIDYYERILKDYSLVMNSHGAIFFEFNYDQKNALEDLINKYVKDAKYEFYKDTFGKWRYVRIIF